MAGTLFIVFQQNILTKWPPRVECLDWDADKQLWTIRGKQFVFAEAGHNFD